MKQRQGIALILLWAVFFTPQACGRKGPPFLPAKESFFKVEQLKAEYENGVFHLKGAVAYSRGRTKEASNIIGCRIYLGYYTLDNPPCESCPIDYGEFIEVKGDVIAQGVFSCQVPVKKKKGIHFFSVRLIGQGGEIGPFSDNAKIIIED